MRRSAPSACVRSDTGRGASTLDDVRTATQYGSLARAIPAGRIGHTVRRGLVWAVAGQWGAYVVQMLTTIVLARFLSPTDFGLVAMAFTLTIVADQFRSLGLSHAVIQRPDLSWQQVNAMFWINFVAGIVLAGFVAITGPLVATFYDDQRIVGICWVLSASYVLSGLAVQHNALLSRQLNFRSIALRNGLSRLAASILAITAALLGAGYWSLVLLQVGINLFTLAFVWTAVRWRPSRPRALGSAMPLVRFGAGVSVGSMLNTISRQADNVLIGKFLGAGALGLYGRAYGLLMMPLRQIKDPLGSIVLPMLAALQGEPQRYRALYRSAIAGLAHVGMPVIAIVAVGAHPIVVVLLGRRWEPAAPLFQLLAIAGFFQLVSATTGWLFVSSGRSRAYATWAAVSSAITVAAFAVGLQWEVRGVAASYALSQTAMLLPSFAVAVRRTPVSLTDVVTTLMRPLAVAAFVLTASWVAARAVAHAPELLELGVTCGAGALAWTIVLLAWGSARAEIRRFVNLARPGYGSPPAGGEP